MVRKRENERRIEVEEAQAIAPCITMLSERVSVRISRASKVETGVYRYIEGVCLAAFWYMFPPLYLSFCRVVRTFSGGGGRLE